MTEDEAITVLIGRKSGYEWDERLLPGSCGAWMRDFAWNAPFIADAELYSIAKDFDKTELVRMLAAKLYVAERRLAVAVQRLGER